MIIDGTEIVDEVVFDSTAAYVTPPTVIIKGEGDIDGTELIMDVEVLLESVDDPATTTAEKEDVIIMLAMLDEEEVDNDAVMLLVLMTFDGSKILVVEGV